MPANFNLDPSVSVVTSTNGAALEQRDLLDAVLITAPAGIAFLDRELRFIEVNGNFAALDGVPAVEHPGRALADLTPDLAPALTPRLRAVSSSWESAAGR